MGVGDRVAFTLIIINNWTIAIVREVLIYVLKTKYIQLFISPNGCNITRSKICFKYYLILLFIQYFQKYTF